MKGTTVITHPLVQHNLTRLRDKRTRPQEFRRLLGEIAALMLYEATRSFATRLRANAALVMSRTTIATRSRARAGAACGARHVGFHLATRSQCARGVHW